MYILDWASFWTIGYRNYQMLQKAKALLEVIKCIFFIIVISWGWYLIQNLLVYCIAQIEIKHKLT